jgi:hypothetical protein
MKSFMCAVVFLASSVCGDAMIHANRPAPVLHSVFDPALSPPSPPFTRQLFLNSPEAAATFTGPHHLGTGKAARRRETGIYLTVFGAIALAGAVMLFKNGDKEEEQSRRTGGSKSAGMGYYLLGAVVGCAGLGLFIPGVVVLIYYSTRKHRWD